MVCNGMIACTTTPRPRLSTSMHLLLATLIVLAALMAAPASAAARAWLDRDTITLGETVTLNVESNRAEHAPDFSVLTGDFELLGTSSSTQVRIENGQRSMVVLRAVTMQPRRAGTITIPALDLGGEQTAPVQLTVQEPAQAPRDAAAGGRAQDVFLEVEAEPRTPWVQQQVRYTLRLYYAVTLLEGQLDEPVAEHADVRRLGQDASFQRDIGGRRYNVVERHYAVVPERSGSITIPAPGFRGRAMLPGRRSSWVGGGATVSAMGDAVTLDVQPRPDGATEPWLPAADLSLEDASGKLPKTLTVGEPVTLTLRLRARGLAAAQLPELELGAIAGADVYPDQAVVRDGNDGAWQLGERERKFAVVPQRPGTLQLPAVELRWFDTDDRSFRTASIPPRVLEVQPGDGAAASVGTPPAAGWQAPGEDAPGIATPGPWRPLAITFGVLWLATLVGAAWWYRRRPVPAVTSASAVTAATPAPAPRAREARAALAAALESGSLAAAAAALRDLAAADGRPLLSLGALAARLVPAQREAIGALEDARFGDGDAAQAMDRLRREFAAGQLHWEQDRTGAGDDGPLPPLYPR